jgi:hypothetical protein
MLAFSYNLTLAGFMISPPEFVTFERLIFLVRVLLFTTFQAFS